jgi:hypothetical protein
MILLLRFAFNLILAAALLLPFAAQNEAAQAVQRNCRIGIAVPQGIQGYDLGTLQAGALLDWQFDTSYKLPDGMEYTRMLRVGDFEKRFEKAQKLAPKLAKEKPGQYWIIGNEPDTIYEHQDGVLPEVYAERYFTLANLIRQADPEARLGFGGITMPTAIRLRYLDRAWKRLIELAGSREAASKLVDFWTIHAFILNEAPGEWGVGVPPGFEEDHQDVAKITNLADTHSVEIFSQRIERFRHWMAEKGERDKALWITEFGNLLPPLDPPKGPTVAKTSDEETARFLQDSFEYLEKASDLITGMPTDRHHLVQRWYWYSLNDFRYKFGGALFDPENNKKRTLVGDAFSAYRSYQEDQDIFLAGYTLSENAEGQTLTVNVANAGIKSSRPYILRIYADASKTDMLAEIVLEAIPGCGGQVDYEFNLPTPAAGTVYWMVELLSQDGLEPAASAPVWVGDHSPGELLSPDCRFGCFWRNP